MVLQKNFRKDVAAELGQSSKDKYALGLWPKMEGSAKPEEKVSKGEEENCSNELEKWGRAGEAELPTPRAAGAVMLRSRRQWVQQRGWLTAIFAPLGNMSLFATVFLETYKRRTPQTFTCPPIKTDTAHVCPICIRSHCP